MSYIPQDRRIDAIMSSQGDGSGVTDMGVDGHAITAATTASPVVCTTGGGAHGYVVGDWIWVDGATGITEINGLRQINTVPIGTTFTLKDEAGDVINSTGTFGGTCDTNIALIYKPVSTIVARIRNLNGVASDGANVNDAMLGVARLASTGIVFALYGTSGLITTFATIYGWHDWGLYGHAAIRGVAALTAAEMLWTFNKSVEGTLDQTDIKVDGALGQFLAIYTDEDLAGLVAMRYGVQGISQ